MIIAIQYDGLGGLQDGSFGLGSFGQIGQNDGDAGVVWIAAIDVSLV